MRKNTNDKTINADRIVRGLIDRLIRNERAIESLREELNDQREVFADWCPKLTPGGWVELRVLGPDPDVSQVFYATITPALVKNEASEAAKEVRA